MAAADQTAVTRVVVNFRKAIGAYGGARAARARSTPGYAATRPRSLARRRRSARLPRDCVRCHGGPSLSDQGVSGVGVKPVANDPRSRVSSSSTTAASPAGVAQLALDPLRTRAGFSDGTDARHQLDPGRGAARRDPHARAFAVSTRAVVPPLGPPRDARVGGGVLPPRRRHVRLPGHERAASARSHRARGRRISSRSSARSTAPAPQGATPLTPARAIRESRCV